MTQYQATIHWKRGHQVFTDNHYSRGHTWAFDGGITMPASSSPHIVPLPYSIANAVDPEEAFVASLSSCHMLWFLSIAAKRGFCVDSYADQAIGILEKNNAGRLAITRAILRPHAIFCGNSLPTKIEIDAIHHEAHEECYIANSVKTIIEFEPIYVGT